MRGKRVISPEKTLRKDYDRKGSVGGKKSLVMILKVFDAKTN
jgi:hypothetical protein